MLILPFIHTLYIGLTINYWEKKYYFRFKYTIWLKSKQNIIGYISCHYLNNVEHILFSDVGWMEAKYRELTPESEVGGGGTVKENFWFLDFYINAMLCFHFYILHVTAAHEYFPSCVYTTIWRHALGNKTCQRLSDDDAQVLFYLHCLFQVVVLNPFLFRSSPPVFCQHFEQTHSWLFYK